MPRLVAAFLVATFEPLVVVFVALLCVVAGARGFASADDVAEDFGVVFASVVAGAGFALALDGFAEGVGLVSPVARAVGFGIADAAEPEGFVSAVDVPDGLAVDLGGAFASADDRVAFASTLAGVGGFAGAFAVGVPFASVAEVVGFAVAGLALVVFGVARASEVGLVDLGIDGFATAVAGSDEAFVTAVVDAGPGAGAVRATFGNTASDEAASDAVASSIEIGCFAPAITSRV